MLEEVYCGQKRQYTVDYMVSFKISSPIERYCKVAFFKCPLRAVTFRKQFFEYEKNHFLQAGNVAVKVCKLLLVYVIMMWQSYDCWEHINGVEVDYVTVVI